ncbi:MAG: hypothetical protein IPP53_03880 [Bacteroidetes bacterium]|nr:hypothetical protein [Bacteroidota bacterium]
MILKLASTFKNGSSMPIKLFSTDVNGLNYQKWIFICKFYKKKKKKKKEKLSSKREINLGDLILSNGGGLGGQKKLKNTGGFRGGGIEKKKILKKIF